MKTKPKSDKIIGDKMIPKHPKTKIILSQIIFPKNQLSRPGNQLGAAEKGHPLRLTRTAFEADLTCFSPR